MAATDDKSSEMLSNRALNTFYNKDFVCSYITRCNLNPFHPELNPKGIVKLGEAVNKLLEKEMEERLNRKDAFHFRSIDHQHYFDLHGKPALRKAIADFFNRYLKPPVEIFSDELVVLSGTDSCLDSLSFALFDPHDVLLVPTPTYARLFTNFNDRSLAQPYPFELSDQPDSNGNIFTLDAGKLEKRILQLRGNGKIVKGVVLSNPQNPLGDIYSPQLLKSILNMCARYEIHVIIDEVFMFSLLSEQTNPCSVMSLQQLPDPERTHVVWGMSKDFGLSGFRIGVVFTRNSAVVKVLKDLSIYCCSASIIQDATTAILSDTKWLDNVYFPTFKQRLISHHEICVKRLEEMGGIVKPSQGGLFVWVNFKKFLKSNTDEAEMELSNEFYDAGVFVEPGCMFYCMCPGWFRIVFSVTPVELETGLNIMEDVLKKRSQ